jgi:hypothetical protein
LLLCTVLFQDLLTWVATSESLVFLRTVFSCSLSFHLFSSSLICCRPACNTSITVTMSFGGRAWPINPLDFKAGQVNTDPNPLCIGAIFDLSLATNMSDSSTPAWVIGDTFLVRNLSRVYRCPSRSSYSFILLSRKTCTRCSVPHHCLLGLPNCLLQLVGYVQQDPEAPSRVPRALAPQLGFLVCVAFFLQNWRRQVP